MKSKLSTRLVIGCILAALTVAACGAGVDENRASAPTEIKIGSPLGLSGPAAFVGISSQRSLQIAVDMFNDAPEEWIGPNRTISFDIQDIGSDESRTLTIAQSMVSDNSTVGIVGPSLATQVAPLAEMLQSASVPMVSPTSFSPTTTDAGDFIFQTPVTGQYLIDPIVDVAVNDLGADTVGIVYNDDNQANLLLKEIAEEALMDAGVEVISISTLFADTNFSTAITQLQAAEVATIFALVGQTASLQIQAQQAGFEPVFLGTPTMGSESHLANAGSATEGAIFATDYLPSLDTDLNQHFVREYDERFELVPDSFAATTHAAATVLATAIKSIEGEVTRDALRDALDHVKDAPVVVGDGKFTFDDNRMSVGPAILLTVRDGVFVPYEP